jgi:hypothetical protein
MNNKPPFLLICGLMLLATVSSGFAASVPAPVEQEVADKQKLCQEAGGNLINSADLIKNMDLNGDGITDFIVDERAYNCSGADSIFGGTASTLATIWVSGGQDSFKQAWSGYNYGLEVTDSKVWLKLGGDFCGPAGAATHATMMCRRALQWNAKTQVLELEDLSKVQPAK